MVPVINRSKKQKPEALFSPDDDCATSSFFTLGGPSQGLSLLKVRNYYSTKIQNGKTDLRRTLLQV